MKTTETTDTITKEVLRMWTFVAFGPELPGELSDEPDGGRWMPTNPDSLTDADLAAICAAFADMQTRQTGSLPATVCRVWKNDQRTGPAAIVRRAGAR